MKNTIDFVLQSQFASGNIPHVVPAERDHLVQFCHGSTGALPMFLAAHQHFKEQKYLDAALNCGEAIWHRGLLK